jgi:hypothetical protein
MKIKSFHLWLPFHRHFAWLTALPDEIHAVLQHTMIEQNHTTLTSSKEREKQSTSRCQVEAKTNIFSSNTELACGVSIYWLLFHETL